MMLSERVRPQLIASLIGNEQARLELVRWLKNWKLGTKAVLLTGPPGVGKSTSIYAVASEFGYGVVEYNASDVRTKTKLSESLGPSLKNASLFGQNEKMLMFLDEVDGLGRADYGGVDFILEFIENATMPVAMAANVEDDPKLKKLEQKCEVIRFAPVNEKLIQIYLRTIAKREGINVSESTLTQIAKNCRGDVRFALNLLQTVVEDRANLLQTDKQFFSNASAMESILSSQTLQETLVRLRQFDASPFEKVQMVFDSVVSSKTFSEGERAEALKLVADADILLQQINRSQRWRLLRYLDRYLAHAILVSRLARVESSIPWNLRISIWNNGRVVRELLQDLPGDFHVGRSSFAAYYLPYLAFYFKNRSKELNQFLSIHEYGDSERRVILKMAT